MPAVLSKFQINTPSRVPKGKRSQLKEVEMLDKLVVKQGGNASMWMRLMAWIIGHKPSLTERAVMIGIDTSELIHDAIKELIDSVSKLFTGIKNQLRKIAHVICTLVLAFIRQAKNALLETVQFMRRLAQRVGLLDTEEEILSDLEKRHVEKKKAKFQQKFGSDPKTRRQTDDGIDLNSDQDWFLFTWFAKIMVKAMEMLTYITPFGNLNKINAFMTLGRNCGYFDLVGKSKELVNWFYHMITGEDLIMDVKMRKHFDKNYREIISLVDTLDTLKNPTHAKLLELRKLKREFDTSLDYLLISFPKESTYYNVIKGVVEKKVINYTVALQANERRMKPVSMFCRGEPGIGKSTFQEAATKDIMSVISSFIDKRPAADRIIYAEHASRPTRFSRNCLEEAPEYDDGYTNSMFMCLEEYQTASNNDTKAKWAIKTFQYMDDQPLMLNMAFGDKGKRFYDSPFLIATGNFERHVIPLEKPGAFFRRIDFDYLVTSTRRSGEPFDLERHTRYQLSKECVDMLKQPYAPHRAFDIYNQWFGNTRGRIYPSSVLRYKEVVVLAAIVYLIRIDAGSYKMTEVSYADEIAKEYPLSGNYEPLSRRMYSATFNVPPVDPNTGNDMYVADDYDFFPSNVGLDELHDCKGKEKDKNNENDKAELYRYEDDDEFPADVVFAELKHQYYAITKKTAELRAAKYGEIEFNEFLSRQYREDEHIKNFMHQFGCLYHKGTPEQKQLYLTTIKELFVLRAYIVEFDLSEEGQDSYEEVDPPTNKQGGDDEPLVVANFRKFINTFNPDLACWTIREIKRLTVDYLKLITDQFKLDYGATRKLDQYCNVYAEYAKFSYSVIGIRNKYKKLPPQKGRGLVRGVLTDIKWMYHTLQAISLRAGASTPKEVEADTTRLGSLNFRKAYANNFTTAQRKHCLDKSPFKLGYTPKQERFNIEMLERREIWLKKRRAKNAKRRADALAAKKAKREAMRMQMIAEKKQLGTDRFDRKQFQITGPSWADDYDEEEPETYDYESEQLAIDVLYGHEEDEYREQREHKLGEEFEWARRATVQRDPRTRKQGWSDVSDNYIADPTSPGRGIYQHFKPSIDESHSFMARFYAKYGEAHIYDVIKYGMYDDDDYDHPYCNVVTGFLVNLCHSRGFMKTIKFDWFSFIWQTQLNIKPVTTQDFMYSLYDEMDPDVLIARYYCNQRWGTKYTRDQIFNALVYLKQIEPAFMGNQFFDEPEHIMPLANHDMRDLRHHMKLMSKTKFYKIERQIEPEEGFSIQGAIGIAVLGALIVGVIKTVLGYYKKEQSAVNTLLDMTDDEQAEYVAAIEELTTGQSIDNKRPMQGKMNKANLRDRYHARYYPDKHVKSQGVQDHTLYEKVMNSMYVLVSSSGVAMGHILMVCGTIGVLNEHVYDAIKSVDMLPYKPSVCIQRLNFPKSEMRLLQRLPNQDKVIVSIPHLKNHANLVKYMMTKNEYKRFEMTGVQILTYDVNSLVGTFDAVSNLQKRDHGRFNIHNVVNEPPIYVDDRVVYTYNNCNPGVCGSIGVGQISGQFRIMFQHAAGQQQKNFGIGIPIFKEDFDFILASDHTELSTVLQCGEDIGFEYDDPIQSAYTIDYVTQEITSPIFTTPFNKTIFVPTEFEKEKFRGGCGGGPAILDKNSYRACLEKEIVAKKIHNYNLPTVHNIIRTYTDELGKLLTRSAQPIVGCRTLTPHEAIYGVANLEPLNFKSANGVRLKLMGLDGENLQDPDSETTTKVVAYLYEAERLKDDGHFCHQINNDCLKDEIRVEEKRKVPRNFNVTDKLDNLEIKRYTGDFVSKCKNTFMLGPAMCGINPTCAAWQMLANDFDDPEMNVVAKDVKHWDFCLLKWMIMVIGPVLYRAYGHNRLSYRKAMWSVISCIQAMRFSFGIGRIANQGNSSGVWITTQLNTWANITLHGVSCIHGALRNGEDPCYALWKLHLAIYSDDNISGSKSLWWNGHFVVTVFEELFNITLTNTDKTTDHDFDRHYTIWDCEFLSRRFVKRDGIVYAPLAHSSVLSQLYYIRMPNKSAGREFYYTQLQQNVDNVMRELCEYEPKEAFQITNEILKFVAEHHLPLVVKPFEYNLGAELKLTYF